MYLPFLLVRRVALFHLVSRAHLLYQKVLDCQENQDHQGVREAHPCLQAQRYQGDPDYPKKNFKEQSVSCVT